MTTKEKSEKILLELYSLKKAGKIKANPIPISSIIEMNVLESRRLGKYLKDNGWVTGRDIGSGFAVFLTVQGEIYIEENLLKKDRQSNFKPLKTREKYDIILSELYSNYGKFIEVSELLQDHQETSLDEAHDLGQALEAKGYVKLSYSKTNSAVAITSLGREYVEDHLLKEIKYEPTDKINDIDKNILSDKIDEMISKFKDLEIVQSEKLDNLEKELLEMKSLLGVLGKKNWRQILFGKITDAGLGTLTQKAFDIFLSTFGDQNLLS